MSSIPDASARAIRLLCEDVKASLARGELPTDSMAELKKVLDETRMRLWAAMEAARSGDPTWVQEFWLQRAAEVCLSLVQHLDRGELDRKSPRAAELRAIAERLAASLAPGHG
jgi:HAMP domain-containing protein